MTAYIALLRAVNVGGTGKFPMQELRAIAESAGFSKVRTYIASGNLLFESPLTEAGVKAKLAKPLQDFAGKPVGLLVRTASEMAQTLRANPFPEAKPNYCYAFFLDGPPPANALETVSGEAGERIALGAREIYVAYPKGSGVSKLKMPAAKEATARNMNTVAKLAELAGDL